MYGETKANAFVFLQLVRTITVNLFPDVNQFFSSGLAQFFSSPPGVARSRETENHVSVPLKYFGAKVHIIYIASKIFQRTMCFF